MQDWKPNTVPDKDLLISLSYEKGEEFFSLPLIQGRSGPFPSEQNFTRWCISGNQARPLALVGTQLELCFLERVAPMPSVSRRKPLDQQSWGALDALTEEELAHHIVTTCSTESGLCSLRTVTIRQLQYRDLDLYRVEILGFATGLHG